MRVLITGAYGFIGSHIAAHLRTQGHEIIAAGRDISYGQRRFPFYRWISCDFNRDTEINTWLPRLIDVDAVVNCVGILQGSARDKAEAIHHTAPAALFSACEKVGIRRIVQISALGAGHKANTTYGTSKAAGDKALASCDLDWVILRPSLVYGRGTFGGTTLMRGLAGVPLVTPVPASNQLIQPIFVEDLAIVVSRMLDPVAPSKIVLDTVGPKEMTAADFIKAQRRWLGFKRQPVLPIPKFLSAIVFKLGDISGLFGSRTAMRSTFLAMMDTPNTGPIETLVTASGSVPQSVEQVFAATPAQNQDRWHARLIFLKPLLRFTLAIFWMATGLLLLHPHTLAAAVAHIEAASLVPSFAPMVTAKHMAIGSGVFDMLVGLLLFMGWKVRAALSLQILATLAYLAALSFALPGLWLDPLGPLTKAVPLLVFTAALMAMQDER